MFLYIFGLAAMFFVHSQAVETGKAAAAVGSRKNPAFFVIFGFIETASYRYEETPDSFGRLPSETVGLVQPPELRRRDLGLLRGLSIRALRGDAAQQGRQVESRGVQGHRRLLRDDQALSRACWSRRAGRTRSQASSAACSAATSFRRSKAVFPNSTRSTSSAPTMSKPRSRW